MKEKSKEQMLIELKELRKKSKKEKEELKAANQQLLSSEQQLRAANQQLQASEQQLRAANQQLDTSNQQLRATEQQLRAANQQLTESEEKYRMLFQNMLDGFAYHQIVTDENGKAIDYIFMEINDAFEELTGLKRTKIIGKKVTEALPGIENDAADWIGKYGEVALAGKELHFEQYSEALDRWFSVSAFCPKEGYFATIFENITKRKKAEEKLKESEEKYRALFEKEEDAIFIFEPDTFIIVDANPAMTKTYGYSYDELIGMNCLNLSAEKEKSKTAAAEADKKGKVDVKLRWHKKKDGTVFPLELQVYQTELGGSTVGYAVARDITERKQAEEELQKSKRDLQALISNSPVCTKIIDLDFNLQYMSDAGVNQLKIEDINKFYGKPYPVCFFPEKFKKEMSEKMIEVKKSGKTLEMEGELADTEGNRLWYNHILAPVKDGNGKIEYMLIVSMDITERKRAEEQIQKNLEEKEILLRELYHRTKNNMQVICSFLRMHASRLEDKKTKEIFEEIETKIYSMALVHQKLISSKDLSNLNLKDYFDTLLIHIKESNFEFLKNISIRTDMKDISVLIDTAIPLGLVLNELVSNAGKHAFPDNGRGEIKVHLNLTPKNEIVFDVSDNGVGLPKGFDIQKDAGLGLETAIALVQHQLDGTIDFKSKNGLHCRIVIKEELSKPRI